MRLSRALFLCLSRLPFPDRSHVHPVNLQRFATWSLLRMLRQTKQTSFERGVFAFSQRWSDRHFVSQRIDRDQRAVVECVQVGAQQESISDVVGFRAHVAADVSGFENLWDIAAR